MKNPVIIDIIFISYSATNSLREMTQQAINTLISSEDQSEICFNIIVVDSYKQAGSFQYEHAYTIYPKEKFGYNRYLNIGISKGYGKYVCVCNNDLIFHKNWAKEIMKAFCEDTMLQSGSPLCVEYHKKWKLDMTTGRIYGYQIEKEVCGWCIFFKRDLFNSIKPFDPRFRFWFADNDYALTLQKNNISHALITSSLVDHLRSQTLAHKSGYDKRRLTTSEKFYFEYKWKGRSFLSYLFNYFLYNLKIWIGKHLTLISNKLKR